VRTVAAHDTDRVLRNRTLSMRGAFFRASCLFEEVRRCTFAVTLEEEQATAPGQRTRATFTSRIALAGGIHRTRTHAAVTFGGSDPEITSAASGHPPTMSNCPRPGVPRSHSLWPLSATFAIGCDSAATRHGTVRSPDPPPSRSVARRMSVSGRQRHAPRMSLGTALRGLCGLPDGVCCSPDCFSSHARGKALA